MEKTRTFEDLDMWKKAHDFVLNVYKITENFPKTEVYGLTSQFRRASVSIAANIAEGYKKKGKADKLRFYNIAQGSLEECRYFIILSRDLKYIHDSEFTLLNESIKHASFLLNNYMNAFKE
jgi:four helix bundle protein